MTNYVEGNWAQAREATPTGKKARMYKWKSGIDRLRLATTPFIFSTHTVQHPTRVAFGRPDYLVMVCSGDATCTGCNSPDPAMNQKKEAYAAVICHVGHKDGPNEGWKRVGTPKWWGFGNDKYTSLYKLERTLKSVIRGGVMGCDLEVTGDVSKPDPAQKQALVIFGLNDEQSLLDQPMQEATLKVMQALKDEFLAPTTMADFQKWWNGPQQGGQAAPSQSGGGFQNAAAGFADQGFGNAAPAQQLKPAGFGTAALVTNPPTTSAMPTGFAPATSQPAQPVGFAVPSQPTYPQPTGFNAPQVVGAPGSVVVNEEDLPF